MAWEKRGRTSKTYYTRTHRVGGKRVRVYFGSTDLGEIAWLVDTIRRLAAELARRKKAAR